MANPFDTNKPRERGAKTFAREEVRLANRNHGFALELMRHDITPTGMHYLLTHFDVPHLPDAEFRLSISGAVERPLTLTLDNIKSRPQTDLAVIMECAGNGRAVYDDRSRSMPWHYEAVGNSVWTGTPLIDVLNEASIQNSAEEIVFLGADRGFDKGVEHNFGRSLTLQQVADKNILLVTGMNGLPLLPQHGAPLRLLVPGWYGMASVKWLTKIQVWERPFDGFQQVETYRYRKDADDPGTGVQALKVKSLMIPPGIPDWYSRQRVVESGGQKIAGRAWTGSGATITKVEFSSDMETWAEATLFPKAERLAWQRWECHWNAEPGEYVLRCRATDEFGNVQPLESPWDLAGFGNNVVQEVPVFVR